MRLVVLGGSAACPNPGQGCSGYLLLEDNTAMLLDCGPGTLPELLQHISMDALDAVIITHLHQDHVLDLVPLRYGLKYAPGLKRRRLSVWLPPGGRRYLDELARVVSLGSERSDDFFTETFEIQEYDPERPLQVRSWRILFHPTRHWVPCWALRVEGMQSTIAYLADTGWDNSLIQFAQDVDLLIVEATLPPDIENGAREGHLDAEEAGRIAALAGTRQLLLTHYWATPEVPTEVMRATRHFGGRVYLARPGLTIDLDERRDQP
ncbi:Ribonuclease BN [bacterium HR28]|nr:Ribonuclease BN [bacterium HR28]